MHLGRLAFAHHHQAAARWHRGQIRGDRVDPLPLFALGRAHARAAAQPAAERFTMCVGGQGGGDGAHLGVVAHQAVIG